MFPPGPYHWTLLDDFLEIFKRNPDADPDEYRNRNGEGSPARVANCLIHLMRDALKRSAL